MTTDELEAETASRDLERLSSRLLELESRLSEVSAFERGLFGIWGEDGDTQTQLREWYGELPHIQRYPLDELYAGVLEGEAGLQERLKHSISVWETQDPPFPIFQDLLEVSYLGQNQKKIDFDVLQAQLAEKVPGNWFYFQLAKRLALQGGDQSLHESFQDQFHQLTDLQLWQWRVLVSVELLLVGIGCLSAVFVAVSWFTQRRIRSLELSKQQISPWTFYEGLAVLVRGGALSILLIVVFATFPSGRILLEDYGSLLLYLPTVGLAWLLLCRPKQQSLFAVLGCKKPLQRFRSSFPILLSAISLGLIGDWVMMLVGDTFDMTVHWTEWFLESVVWGSQAVLLKTTLEVVLLAPIFEEIIFRGMVFSTLRAKFGISASMIGSAVVFALAHGYGPMAFLTVLWSGLLWAWTYERTGSLIPGICAHIINNGLVTAFLVLLFR